MIYVYAIARYKIFDRHGDRKKLRRKLTVDVEKNPSVRYRLYRSHYYGYATTPATIPHVCGYITNKHDYIVLYDCYELFAAIIGNFNR